MQPRMSALQEAEQFSKFVLHAGLYLAWNLAYKKYPVILRFVHVQKLFCVYFITFMK